MSTVTYTYDPGTTVYVLISGSCPATFTAEAAIINRVEIKVSQSTPAPVTTIDYVVTLIDDSSIRTVGQIDVFVDKPTAVTEAMARYQTTFA
jgi:hypothetical protein